jgi:plastocyanin
MRALRPLLRPVLVCIVAGCSNNTTGTTGNNAPPPPPATNDIDIRVGAQNLGNAAFNPADKSITVADPTVRWVNQDISGGDYTQGTAVIHRIESTDQPAAFTASQNLGGNAVYTATLPAVAGTYHYHCSIHPTMVGTITITP